MQNAVTPSVAVLLTCHNRIEKTMHCLDVVFKQASANNINLTVILVDDGCIDGTSNSVRKRYPQVQILVGDGKLFWNRGMHLAFGKAMEDSFDYYLWLNDDIHLHEGAIYKLLSFHQYLLNKGKPNSIIISSTRDPVGGEFTYGGYKRASSLFPSSLRLVSPSDRLEPCDTFCGNCVLIPRQVADKVGNLDPEYLHRWGDVDYGLRALENNCTTWIAPGYLADCEGNSLADKWRDPTLPILERVRELHSLKGLGAHDWPKFIRRHGGTFWPLFWIRPYLRILYDTLVNAPKIIATWTSRQQ